MAALGGALLAALLAQASSIPERFDGQAFDAQARIARAWFGPDRDAAPQGDVVVVGIDDESLDRLGVPLAMMHASLGAALEAIARGGPRAIGLDLALPAQSFDPLAPGLDRALMLGMIAARRSAPLVLALDADAQGRLRVPDLPLLAAAGGREAFGLPLFPLDCDGVVRRYDPQPGWSRQSSACAPAPPGGAGGAAAQLPTFAARLAQRAGRGDALERAGWIDYTRGAPFTYVPLGSVVAWGRDGEVQRLRALFGGRVVLLGSVLPFLDRLRLPVALADWQRREGGAPGVVVNAQVLRNALGAGLLRAPAAPFAALAALAMACLAFLRRGALRWGLWLLAVLAALFLGAVLQDRGWFLAPSAPLLAGAAAAALRGAIERGRERRERKWLADALGAYLSPQVRDRLLAGRGTAAGARRAVALLFADLRGFTAWSESADPALVHETLNRYYALITPVLHAHGGMIDNFRGDGVMAVFGAPESAAQPCAAAFAAAREICTLSRRFVAERLGLSGVSVGLAYGEAVVGELGSAARRDYTALGDAVNVAARLQELARELDVPVVMTGEFARRLPEGTPGIEPLGLRPIRGHSPLVVCGFRGAAH